MEALKDLIFSESGRVQDGIPHEREIIYVGRNGQKVERIRVKMDDKMTSFIYKPLTNYPTMGKEVWVQENISLRIPKVHVPRINYYSRAKEPEDYWMVFEDLGELEHNFRADIMKKTAELMPYWHLLPTSLVPNEFEGHSPHMKEIQGFILSKAVQMRELFISNGFSYDHIDYFYREILLQDHFENETVISHGDLYPLNIAEVNQKLFIFDWEYIHKNSVFWDLYTLMDITSPQYRRPVMNQTARLDILSRYISVRHSLKSPTNTNFICDYHKYSALHAIWLLLIIEEEIVTRKVRKISPFTATKRNT
jgi:hypothetical protein